MATVPQTQVPNTQRPQTSLPFIKKEDSWAMIIALLLTAAITLFYLTENFAVFKSMAVSVPTWSDDFGKVSAGLSKNPAGIYILFGFFVICFTAAAKIMGYNVK